jgi:hypothetical protein
MKTKYLILFAAFSSLLFLHPKNSMGQNIQDKVQSCATSAGTDVTYLKDFIVKLEGIQPNEKPPLFRTTLVLRKGVIYRFSLCNLDSSAGEAVLRVYDEANMLASTFYPETGKEYKSINFACQKSGVYTVMISFKEGKPGEAIGIMSYVNK